MKVLVIDVGGTNVKILATGQELARKFPSGATLTPEEGVWLAGPVGEATRETVNQWIRSSGAFDTVIDFDAIVRDKDHPAKIREDLDPGDHIHPNDRGNAAMADALPLSTFIEQ